MDWKGILGSIAPTIATAVGGPFGGLAATAALKALGIESQPDTAESKLEEVIKTASPETLLKLKSADYQFKTDMKKLDVDIMKIDADDRGSARAREVATKDNAPKILAAVIVIGFFTTLYCVAFIGIPETAQQPVNILLGSLTALIIQVGNYYFGSSAGSKQKTAVMHSMANK